MNGNLMGYTSEHVYYIYKAVPQAVNAKLVNLYFQFHGKVYGRHIEQFIGVINQLCHRGSFLGTILWETHHMENP
jgi:hypothetical protein